MYWITKNLATSSMSEFMLRKRKNVVAVDVRDLIDGEGNDPNIFKSKVDQVEKIISKSKRAVVMCGSGISRSNAVALAYLVRSGMEFDDAYSLIRKKVPVAQIDMALLDLAKKMKIHYPTVEDIIETNKGIVSSDIDKIKKELESSELTREEKDYLERLLKWKQHASKQPFRDPKNDSIRNKLMEEGEKWYRRKDKHFDLDYDVMTD